MFEPWHLRWQLNVGHKYVISREQHRHYDTLQALQSPPDQLEVCRDLVLLKSVGLPPCALVEI